MTASSEHRLLTAIEAATRLDIRPSTIRSWVRRGHLRPASMARGRGRGGVVPTYLETDLVALRDRTGSPPI